MRFESGVPPAPSFAFFISTKWILLDSAKRLFIKGRTVCCFSH